MGPFYNAPQNVLDLAQLVTRMWISFITEGNPNEHGRKFPPKRLRERNTDNDSSRERS